MRRGAFVLFVLLLTGCGSCKDKAKAYLSEPPNEEYQREIERQLPAAEKQATSMCGFPVEGLDDAKVTLMPGSLRRFHIEGKPIAEEKKQKKDAGVDAKKVALCIGVVSLIAWPIVGEGNKVTGYKWDPITLESVETPGVTWTKPTSGGGWD